MTNYLPFGLKRLCVVAFSLSLLAALLLHGCSRQDQEQTQPPRPVRYMIVPPPSTQDAQQRIGEIHAHDEVALSFQLAGRLLTRAVDVGARVNAGQVLATLENETSENQLIAATADLDSARAAEHVAATNLRRMKLLIPSGAIAISALDSAQAEWQAAASKRKSAQASLKIAQQNVGWSRLIAPADGVIIAVSASVGQVLSAGQNVATLAAGDARDAVFDVASPDEMRSNTPQTFVVSLLAANSVKTEATFRDISPQADSKTRTWRVRLTLISPPPALALGASVQTAFSRIGQPAISLPASALTRAGEQPAVFVIDNSNMQLALAPVVISRFSPTHIYVASGVIPGSKVVTAGVMKLRAGEKVSVGETEE